VHGLLKRTIGSEIILDAADGTLGDEALVEAHFGPFEVHGLRQTYHRLSNHFGRTQRYS
jgi:hypothetical protein